MQRYYTAFNMALTTLKTNEMRKLFQPGCLACERDASQIDRMAINGDRITGGATTLSNFTIQMRSPTHIVVRADARTDAVTVKDSAGRITLDQKATTGVKEVTVLRLGGAWIVEGL